MSDRYRIQVRLPPGFKKNTLKLIDELYAMGLVDSKDLSPYVRDAIKEKRDRDLERVGGVGALASKGD